MKCPSCEGTMKFVSAGQVQDGPCYQCGDCGYEEDRDQEEFDPGAEVCPTHNIEVSGDTCPLCAEEE